MRIFIFRIFTVKYFFHEGKHILHIFTGLLLYHFLLIFRSIKLMYRVKYKGPSKWQDLNQNDRRYIMDRKFKFFSINSGFIFILWYENYHFSLVALTTREIFIFTPQDKNKSRIYRKRTWNPSIYFSADTCIG